MVGPFAVNCYLFWDEASCDGVIIDPGDEAEQIMSELEQFGVVPRAILLTHGHGDHIAAVASLKDYYKIPLYIGFGDESMLEDPSLNISAYFDEPILAPRAEHLVKDEDLVVIGAIKLLVIATPGHTPGGVCYLDEEDGFLFCGDTLFAGSIGRTDLPGGDWETLRDSLLNRIMTLDDETVVHSGHGPDTTVGHERRTNPFLADTT